MFGMIGVEVRRVVATQSNPLGNVGNTPHDTIDEPRMGESCLVTGRDHLIVYIYVDTQHQTCVIKDGSVN